MTELKKDIIIGGLFLTGVFGFMAGEFIISTVVFATAATVSNMEFKLKRGR